MNNRQFWTDDELETVVERRDVQRLTWDRVADGMPGRTGNACMMAYYGIKNRQRRAVRAQLDQARENARTERDNARAERDRARLERERSAPLLLAELNRRSRLAAQVKKPVLSDPPRDVPVASSAAVSTARLVADAELRARIEILGPTGGMLGDPLPGRSALHAPRSKEWCGS